MAMAKKKTTLRKHAKQEPKVEDGVFPKGCILTFNFSVTFPNDGGAPTAGKLRIYTKRDKR